MDDEKTNVPEQVSSTGIGVIISFVQRQYARTVGQDPPPPRKWSWYSQTNEVSYKAAYHCTILTYVCFHLGMLVTQRLLTQCDTYWGVLALTVSHCHQYVTRSIGGRRYSAGNFGQGTKWDGRSILTVQICNSFIPNATGSTPVSSLSAHFQRLVTKVTIMISSLTYPCCDFDLRLTRSIRHRGRSARWV